jgi:N-acetylmuramoyl-L-alanine amidase
MSKANDNETTIRMLQQWLRDERGETDDQGRPLKVDGWGATQTRNATGRQLPGFKPSAPPSPVPVVPSPAPAPSPTPRPPSAGGHLVYFAIGHSWQPSSSAVSVGGVREWDYNLEVANISAGLLSGMGIRARILSDHRGSYSGSIGQLAAEMRRERPALCFELHFNSATAASAHGHEHLYHPSDPKSLRLALALASQQQAANIPTDRPRQDRGILARSSGGGAGFLRLHTICPCVLPEPFFGNNPQQWAQFGNDAGKTRLAGIYARSIAGYLGV